MSRIATVVLVATLTLASQASAQEQWGVSLGVTPSWHTGGGVRFLFNADRIDLQGSELRVGVVRGWPLDSDWGVSFVDKTIAENSTLDVDVSTCGRGNCGTFYRTLSQTRMTGLEFHQFQPFKTWKERVQLGMVGAIGVAWLRGNVYKRTTSEERDVESFEADAAELFPPSKSVVPLLRIEVAVAALVVQGVKVRASGGFGMPGYHTFSVTLVYLIPQ
jgi:hypothetical protein